MKITLMICNGAAEVVWNAFRLGNMMLENMDDVTVFLNGPSVKYEDLDSDEFPIKELAKVFTLSEGRLLA